MKLHIYGGPGSGKTTLGLKYSKNYNLEYLDLDNIFWDHSNGRYSNINSEVYRKKNLEQFIKQNEEWVIEGVYTGWINSSLSHADNIIVLNTNVLVRNYRIIKRYLIRKKNKDQNQETLKSIYDLIKWNFKYQKKFNNHLEYLKEHYEKKLIIK